jgi:hypothetical protein
LRKIQKETERDRKGYKETKRFMKKQKKIDRQRGTGIDRVTEIHRKTGRERYR